MRQINLSISILDTVDTTTGQVLTPAPGARVVTIKDSNIIWQVFAEMIWIVSLRKVWEELKNYQLPWKKLSIKQCLINFFLAMIMLYLSNFDVYSDINLAHDYIAGAPYFYILSNDTYHQEIIHLNCTVNDDTIQYNVFLAVNGVNCNAKDLIFGYVTLAIVCAPGKSFYIIHVMSYLYQSKIQDTFGPAEICNFKKLKVHGLCQRW